MREQITSVRIEMETDSDEHVIVRVIDARGMSTAQVRAKVMAFVDETFGTVGEPDNLTRLARDVDAIRGLLSSAFGAPARMRSQR